MAFLCFDLRVTINCQSQVILIKMYSFFFIYLNCKNEILIFYNERWSQLLISYKSKKKLQHKLGERGKISKIK